jgi:hypothetical protein
MASTNLNKRNFALENSVVTKWISMWISACGVLKGKIEAGIQLAIFLKAELCCNSFGVERPVICSVRVLRRQILGGGIYEDDLVVRSTALSARQSRVREA